MHKNGDQYNIERNLFYSILKILSHGCETGPDRRDALRKFGYALRGQPAVWKRLLFCGQRMFSELYELLIGSTNNSSTFLDLLPTMQPSPASSSWTTVPFTMYRISLKVCISKVNPIPEEQVLG